MNIVPLNNQLKRKIKCLICKDSLVVRGFHLNMIIDKINEIIDALNDDSITKLDRFKICKCCDKQKNNRLVRNIHIEEIIIKINEIIITNSLSITLLDVNLINERKFKNIVDVVPVRMFYLDIIIEKINQIISIESQDSFWNSMLSANVNLDSSDRIILTFPEANTDLSVDDILLTIEGVNVPITSSVWNDNSLILVSEYFISPIELVIVTYKIEENNKIVTNELPFYGTIYTGTTVGRFPTNDPYNVNHWNELFNLPTNGVEYTKVLIRNEDGVAKAYLSGGSNITISNFLPDEEIGPNIEFYKREYFRGLYDNYCIKTIDIVGFGSPYNLRFLDLLAVTTISNNSFRDLSTDRISIPLVTYIPSYAFTLCSGEIIISGATFIDAHAFHASTIVSIDIPDTVAYIYEYAFSACFNLTTVNCYGMIAPLITSEGSTPNAVFENNGAVLHIKPGATGYDVEPWTNIAQFGLILQDL